MCRSLDRNILRTAIHIITNSRIVAITRLIHKIYWQASSHKGIFFALVNAGAQINATVNSLGLN